MAAFGLPELVVVAFIVFLIIGGRKLSALGTGSGSALATGDTAHQPAFRTVQFSGYAAAADAAYSSGVRSGTLAECFGHGPLGLQWGRVALVVTGTWLSANIPTFVAVQRLGGDLSSTDLVLMTLSPASFVLSAITAIRSFQSMAVAAVATGVLHSVLFTSIRSAMSGALTGAPGWDGLVRPAIVSFVWPALAILAVGLAASASHRWLPLAVALIVANIVERVLIEAVYGSVFSVAYFTQDEFPVMIVSSLIWATAFWIASAPRYRT